MLLPMSVAPSKPKAEWLSLTLVVEFVPLSKDSTAAPTDPYMVKSLAGEAMGMMRADIASAISFRLIDMCEISLII